MTPEVFALLDDASPDGSTHARSRLYTGHCATLRCRDIAHWPALLEQMQTALARGQHAVALCTYELGEHLQGLSVAEAQPTPLAQVLLFDQCQLLSAPEVGEWLAARSFPIERPAGIAAVRANVDQAEFTAALDRIHAYIEAGDTYQVNYTFRLRFDAFGSLPALYARLRARQPVPYGALVALDDGTAVLSLSPELFVRHADGLLTARPMKGTAPAAPAAQQDENARRAAALAADPKNQAENLMIVDLLRNDIGRVAQTGTVDVPALFEVRRYSGVLQMTSTVQARLREDATLADIFDALYPCGSITGAPKRRTMEIIRELEPNRRGLYTGAIGWFEPTQGRPVGDFCLSVPIRTLALQAEADGVRRGEMGVGAGIVFDSDASAEYAECALKARFLTGLDNDFELFETLYATREDGMRHRERHLARLAASAAYFGYPWDTAAANAYLDATRAALPAGQPCRVRLALAPSGAFSIQHAPLAPLAEPVRVLLAPDTTSASDLFLRHKSSVRTRYDAAWREAEAQGAFDTLFFNERGELTEGGRSCVFVKLDGQWCTPPLASGVLPGVMRSVMLDDPAWQAQERVITRAMFEQAQEIVLCNALRGPIRAVR
ncbi:aminodeoxychorismate synthase component I [Rugamonas apoptosis]|uniref:Aminodeoxychorismate synthase component I n=1 Tax=Rugamonas apoptosis TaxID=2758570 RepID=A0A7W2F685_9BURK|nr:aminodeoxychorismate synthase component I [Rugamonas apoptosis]MBA5685866.1 aminodeoxychorismate synthase component I [Rugamonas apoptosis]